jgi:hypothetical protein
MANLTLNVCVGRSFEGGDIYFQARRARGANGMEEAR